jgi:hypothetical protein
MCELWITNCWPAGLIEERGAWPLATRKSDSLQYGYGAASVSPQRQRASEKLGFFREKNIYKQLAQLATARGATETNISRMLLFLTFAVCSLHKCKTHYGN